MATTFTADASLGYPAHGDRSYDAVVNATIVALDAINALADLAVTIPAAERPTSASLNVRVAPGVFWKSDGTKVAYAGAATQAMSPSATNYVYLTDAGVLTVSTVGFPAAFHVPLAVVVAGGTILTSIADARPAYHAGGLSLGTVYLALAGGTFADSGGVVTLNTGTANGVAIGGSTTQKVGFHGATPTTQRANANQAAITDSTGGTAATTFAAIAAGAAYAQADMVAVKNALAQIALSLNETRLVLVGKGLEKGSA